MERIGEHAVVIGASMAGLLAARALADAYERVTVVERDSLPAGGDCRRAVPQDRHVHALLPYGKACMEALLPGLGAELEADGAPTYRAMEDMRVAFGGHPFARQPLGLSSFVLGRPFLEGHVRRRVRALANVSFLECCDAVGLIGGERVTGVRVLRRADGSAAEALSADLVVCATGRGGRVPAWLRALGYRPPGEDRLAVDIGYASCRVRLPVGALHGDKLVIVGARPGCPRSLFLFAQEGGRWMLTLTGYGPEHRPPAESGDFLEFAEALAPPVVTDAIREAEPLDPIATHVLPANVRRRYERLRRFPDGLLVCGDAVCTFNPVYGQGMTVAAAEAVALRACLERGPERLARRFFAAIAPDVDHAWRLAVGADLALPEVSGRRPLSVRAANRYLRRLRATAEHDPRVAGAFISVVGMRDRPPSVLRPAIARRVLRGPRPGGWERPADGLRRRTLRVGEVETPLREAGPPESREAVVFVHGNPGSGADWEPLIAALGDGRRAVAWDAPGFGGAHAPADFPQTVNAHAEFIADALAELRIERAHLVLHDFGGPWGLRWAAGDPARFASAVLIGTGVTPGYRWHALARVWRTPVLGELFMAARSRAGFRMLLRRGNPRGLPRAFVDRMYADWDSSTRRAVLRLYRSVPDVAQAGELLAEALRPLDRPALVLWGRHDPYLPVALAARQRDAFPRADVRVLDLSGHWPFVDDPEAVSAAVDGFLTEHMEARAAQTLAA